MRRANAHIYPLAQAVCGMRLVWASFRFRLHSCCASGGATWSVARFFPPGYRLMPSVTIPHFS